MPILERACLLRMLAHGHGCLAEYSAAGPSKAKSRSELAASFRIVSTWRLALVQNLRSEMDPIVVQVCAYVVIFLLVSVSSKTVSEFTSTVTVRFCDKSMHTARLCVFVQATQTGW